LKYVGTENSFEILAHVRYAEDRLEVWCYSL